MNITHSLSLSVKKIWGLAGFCLAIQLLAFPVLSETVEVRISSGINDIEQEPAGLI